MKTSFGSLGGKLKAAVIFGWKSKPTVPQMPAPELVPRGSRSENITPSEAEGFTKT
jgi:hypothetical protein